MIYISVRNKSTPNAPRVWADLYENDKCTESVREATADAALKRAWVLWGSHLPAFIRPEVT